MGLRNSLCKISPGCGFRKTPPLAMVIDDFGIRRSSLFPHKANSPLVIDANRILAFPIRLQCLETIARRDTKITQNASLIQQTKFSQSVVLDLGRQSSTPPPGPDQLRFGIDKALNHG